MIDVIGQHHYAATAVQETEIEDHTIVSVEEVAEETPNLEQPVEIPEKNRHWSQMR